MDYLFRSVLRVARVWLAVKTLQYDQTCTIWVFFFLLIMVCSGVEFHGKLKLFFSRQFCIGCGIQFVLIVCFTIH